MKKLKAYTKIPTLSRTYYDVLRVDKILKDELIYILNKLNISSRATHSILKIARTISDLKEENHISREALLEAIEHRKSGEQLIEEF